MMHHYPGADEAPDHLAHRLELARHRNIVLEADNEQLQDRLRDRDDIDNSLEFITGEVVAIASDVARLAAAQQELCDVLRELTGAIKATRKPRGRKP
jgi:hypothetical protein